MEALAYRYETTRRRHFRGPWRATRVMTDSSPNLQTVSPQAFFPSFKHYPFVDVAWAADFVAEFHLVASRSMIRSMIFAT